jgi:hypothetical protein
LIKSINLDRYPRDDAALNNSTLDPLARFSFRRVLNDDRPYRGRYRRRRRVFPSRNDFGLLYRYGDRIEATTGGGRNTPRPWEKR